MKKMLVVPLLLFASAAFRQDDATTTRNVNIKKDVTVTTDAPRPATIATPCLILSGEEHRFNYGSGVVGMTMVAGSKGKWQYIDSYNLPPQFVQTKYKEKDVTKAMKGGVHVVIAHSPAGVRAARVSCQGLVPQK